MSKNYYDILGVNKNASQDEIKKAYRKLAHKHHPDKPNGDEDKFKEVNEAYQILSDEKKKAQYDRFGKTFDGAGQGFGGAGGAGFENMNWEQMGDMGDLGDVLEELFKNFGGGARGRAGRGRRKTYTHGSDIELIHIISLEEAFKGSEKTLEFETFIECSECDGIGYDEDEGLSECSRCDGQGETREQKKTFFGNFSQIKKCSKCDGRGEIPNDKCNNCNGSGRVKDTRKVDLEISPGIDTGKVIKIDGAGEAGKRSSPAGNLYVNIKVRDHSKFKRKGSDLYIEKQVSIIDALLGKDIEIEGISGDKFSISIPKGFNLKENLEVKGRGMPKFNPGSKNSKSDRGSLFISFNVEIPDNLSEEAESLLENLDEEIN